MNRSRKRRPFSVGTAVGDGFALISARPVSVFVWGLLASILTYGPLTGFAGVLIAFYRDLFTGADVEGAVARMNAINAPLQLVSMLSQTIAYAIVGTAVFRAVLRPKANVAFSLRIGAAELRQGLLYLCFVVIFLAAVFALVLASFLIGLVGALSIQAAGAELGGYATWGVFGLLGSAYAALIWFFLRLSLAGPMTFAEGRFRLFESFRITGGRVWRLLGLAVVIYLITIALYAAAVLIGVGLVLLLGLGGAFEAAFKDLDALATAEVLHRLAPFLAGAWAVTALALGPVTALWYGTFASAYRQITSTTEGAS